MLKYRVKRHAVTQPLDKPYRFIPLTQNKNAIVDAKDFEWLSQWNWCAMWCEFTKSFYAVKRTNHKIILMHSLILNCKHGKIGDHKNHNTLDNRRKNLRKATYTQNRCNARKPKNNTSGYKGVSWSKIFGKWEAYIGIHGKKISLGYFKSRKKAAYAYDIAAKKRFGKFTHLNFPISEVAQI